MSHQEKLSELYDLVLHQESDLEEAIAFVESDPQFIIEWGRERRTPKQIDNCHYWDGLITEAMGDWHDPCLRFTLDENFSDDDVREDLQEGMTDIDEELIQIQYNNNLIDMTQLILDILLVPIKAGDQQLLDNLNDDLWRLLGHAISEWVDPLMKLIYNFVTENNILDFAELLSRQNARKEALIHRVSEGRLPYSQYRWILRETIPDGKFDEIMVTTKDSDGQGPLHWVLTDNLIYSARRLRLYLRFDTGMVLLDEDRDGNTPLECFVQQNDPEDITTDRGVRRSYRSILRALGKPEPSWTHLVARKAHLIPHSLFCEVVRLTADNDEFYSPTVYWGNGLSPLHEITKCPSKSNAWNGPKQKSKFFDTNFIHLFEGHKSAVDKKCRVLTRLPLHYSLEAGHDSVVVGRLVSAYPLSVTELDPVTHLLPIFLAAVSDASVGSIFCILRADPGGFLRTRRK